MSTLPLTATKPHYEVLDALRGVAAIMVVCFHIFEAFCTSHLDQQINHGYLAVDFFFILSGFVIAYAYGDRWGSMSTWAFLKRRIIRLQPMVIMGALIGGAMFYTQVCEVWDVNAVSIPALLGAVGMNALMLPAPAGVEVRGLGEMFPLNGPTWSLFFEYVACLLYALLIRRLNTVRLALLVGITGLCLAAFAIFGPLGDICAGFALTPTEFTAGMLRVLFSFSMGLLLFRLFKQPRKLSWGFVACTLMLIVLFSIPRIGGEEKLWLNGIYDSACVLLIFPLLVYVGACSQVSSAWATKLCRFLGDISFPLYIVHYPFLYLYYAWVKNNELSFEQSLPGAAALLFGSILLAWLCLKLYDTPVRRLLAKRFLRS